MAMEINSMEDLNKMINGQAQQSEQSPAEVANTAVEQTAPTTASSQVTHDEAGEPQQSEAAVQPVTEAPQADTASRESLRDKVLSNVQVDLSKIKIVKSTNPLGVFQELETLFLKPSYDVIALQSGYRAAFRSLNNDDMIKVRKFTGTEKEQNMKLFNFVYMHMVNGSLGKIRFDDWLKVTAENDFETLIYGIYCATFPNETDYDVSCPKCGKENKARISKELLIQAKDEAATGAYIQDILSKNYTPEELVKHSVVNMKDRVILPQTKIIADIGTPTLHDYLKSLQRAESFKGYEPEIFTYLKYVEELYIPHIHAFAQGDVEYIQLETIEDKLRAIVDIPSEDRKFLDKAIKDKMDKYKVEYKLPDTNCRHCGAEIKNIVVDMTETLFLSMVRA
jgi:hypothetical protein